MDHTLIDRSNLYSFGTMVVYTGTIGTAYGTVAFGGTTKAITIQNADTTNNNLQFSTDGGTKFCTLFGVGAQYTSYKASHTSIGLKANAAGVSYEIVTIE